MNGTALLWFRRDLRLADNPALAAALARHERVIPVYVHAPAEEGDWAPGAASRWWLHHSLAALDGELRRRGSALVLRRGPTLPALLELAAACGADAVYWNRRYEPAALAQARVVEEGLGAHGIHTQGDNAALLFEPWAIAKKDGGPYRVFTPFWQRAQALGFARPAATAPRHLPPLPPLDPGPPLEALGLLPKLPWSAGLEAAWQPGEAAAHATLDAFLARALARYPQGRDLPGEAGTSRLSPHLCYGEIGPRQVVAAVSLWAATSGGPGAFAVAEAFIRQLAWREFAHHLLYHFPHTAQRPLDPRFDHFAWAGDYHAALTAWQRGQTGIPIVDAGMRELWRTGWMHNRVRMLAASLLTKNLLIPWQEGSRWFWDTLVDADLANNTLGWQWTAGCGADAAPYFRIFNPAVQGARFDPHGHYVRRWVPELARLPDLWLHNPWQAPTAELERRAVALGRDYPRPLVDLAATRLQALERWGQIR